MRERVARPLRSAARTLAIGAGLWLGPLVLLVALLGTRDVFSSLALFFSGAAVVTFGGAYAVLTFVAQQAVEVYGWLSPTEMLDGLAMAETTPGPLIMVVEFVGFLAAFREHGSLDPMVAGLLGAVLVTWVTFVPSFLWVFLGAPYAEHLRGNRRLTGALSAITAAVVGAILNLAIWFGLHAASSPTAGRSGAWSPDSQPVDEAQRASSAWPTPQAHLRPARTPTARAMSSTWDHRVHDGPDIRRLVSRRRG